MSDILLAGIFFLVFGIVLILFSRDYYYAYIYKKERKLDYNKYNNLADYYQHARYEGASDLGYFFTLIGICLLLYELVKFIIWLFKLMF